MNELLLLENPRRKRGRRRSKRRASPAQMRARRKFAKMARARAHARRRNPRTAHGRKVVKHRPVFFGSKTRLGVRSTRKRLNPHSRSNSMARKHRRRYRRNPGFSIKGITSGLMGTVQELAFNTGSIVGGRIVRTQVNALLKTTPANMTVTNVITAVALPTVAGMFFGPAWKKYANVAAAAILADEVKNIPGVGTFLGGNEAAILGQNGNERSTSEQLTYTPPVVF